MSSRIWITWENQRRNRTLSSALDAKLFQLDFKGNRFLRYLKSLSLTYKAFRCERPDIVFVQNPSLILALFAVIYGRVTLIPIVVDAHNAGIFPFEGKKWWANKIVDYLFKNATFTIVTNQALAKYVNGRGGRTLILPDPLPILDHVSSRIQLNGKSNVLFICSFASDEPYLEVIEAGKLISKDICIYITGRYKGNLDDLKMKLPENVVLTGFLPEDDFIRILHSVDCVIDLTTREDCLVCGAYEAVSAERPLIVSATKALMQYFHKGTLYTQNNRTDIAMQIENALQNKEKLIQEIKELKNEKIKEWVSQKAELETKLKTQTVSSNVGTADIGNGC